MQRLYRLTHLVAPRSTTVLITGGTGTGKELVARAIHQLSPRAAKPWAVVNCAAIPEALLESELFGHVRGAFTGAVQGYAGRIHLAQGGTLFLDEVGELPLSLQAKLLRFLDQKEVQRLGSSETLKVDVRVSGGDQRELGLTASRGEVFATTFTTGFPHFPWNCPRSPSARATSCGWRNISCRRSRWPRAKGRRCWTRKRRTCWRRMTGRETCASCNR